MTSRGGSLRTCCVEAQPDNASAARQAIIGACFINLSPFVDREDVATFAAIVVRIASAGPGGGIEMSAVIALLLMQAASSESKVYPSSSGFRVAMAGGSCYLTVVYEGGIETTIFTDETNRVGFIFNQKDWNPVAGKRYKFKVDFGDEYYDLTTTAMENGAFVVSLHPGFLDSYAKASGVDISWGSKSIASLTLVGSSKSIASLRLCMKDEASSFRRR